MEARKIVIRPADASDTVDAPVTRVITTRTPVQEDDVVTRVITTETPARYKIQHEQVEVIPSHPSEPAPENALDYWADRLAPSIRKMLPSRDHAFTATGVSVESEIFYRDEVTEDISGYRLGPPHRVRVKRQKVTLFGTVDRIRDSL